MFTKATRLYNAMSLFYQKNKCAKAQYIFFNQCVDFFFLDETGHSIGFELKVPLW